MDSMSPTEVIAGAFHFGDLYVYEGASDLLSGRIIQVGDEVVRLGTDEVFYFYPENLERFWKKRITEGHTPVYINPLTGAVLNEKTDVVRYTVFRYHS